eukprot:TRINITY_DN556_c0_g1_i3.p1 TRINITY_DN556_c0_g1~~TRINITY_DN556_c0_g1_i3.p1  ORF type:complete len:344 (-),score=45.11 TRINITY_DN556_c0_g1_i3:65-1096(-)
MYVQSKKALEANESEDVNNKNLSADSDKYPSSPSSTDSNEARWSPLTYTLTDSPLNARYRNRNFPKSGSSRGKSNSPTSSPLASKGKVYGYSKNSIDSLEDSSAWQLRNFVFGKAWNSDRWVWIAERDLEEDTIPPQIVITKEKICPLTKIQELWSIGGSISEVVYGSGYWLVLAVNPVYGKKLKSLQALDTSHKFPSPLIKQIWSKGERISYLSYNSYTDSWLLISEDSPSRSQRIKTTSEVPVEEIKQAWEEDRRITGLVAGDDCWTVITEPAEEHVKQSFFARRGIRSSLWLILKLKMCGLLFLNRIMGIFNKDSISLERQMEFQLPKLNHKEFLFRVCN